MTEPSDTMRAPSHPAAREAAARLGVDGFDQHLLLCTGETCDAERTAWSALRRSIRQRGLHRSIHASEVACLGICEDGPVALLHPEGEWFAGVTAERADDVVEQAVGPSRPADDLHVATSPFRGGAAAAATGRRPASRPPTST